MSRAPMLERILQDGGLTATFQPIFRRIRTAWRLHALEALVRGPRDTNLESPAVLFEYVRRKHEQSVVDRACVARILDDAGQLRAAPRISINVHASTLDRDATFPFFLLSTLRDHGMAPQQLIVEVVEHSPFWDGRGFVTALAELREGGVQIALDDVGLGHSNFRMILECRPDYFKVDRYLVHGSSADFYRRALLRAITDMAGSFGAYAVAEGVEDTDDLGTVLAEGLTLVQGFLLCRPQPAAVLGACEWLDGSEAVIEAITQVPVVSGVI